MSNQKVEIVLPQAKQALPQINDNGVTGLYARLAEKKSIRIHYVSGRDGGDSALVSVQELVPEDGLWLKSRPATPSLICLENDRGCDCPWRCIPKISGRCQVLFDNFPSLQQIFVVFDRNEKSVVRKVEFQPHQIQDLSGDQLRAMKQVVPRYLALWVPRDFRTRQPRPYEIKRLNYDGLRILMETSKAIHHPVDADFWAMFS